MMDRLNLSRGALNACVAATLVTDCGGSQPLAGAPTASAQAGRADGVAHHSATTSSYQVLHRFGHAKPVRARRGALPDGGLTIVDDTLYGTTESGGIVLRGVVYSISTTGRCVTRRNSTPHSL